MRVRESGEATHLTPIAELSPGEELHDVQPRAVDADAQELVELAHLGNRWIIGGLEQRPALLLEHSDPGRVAEHSLPFALEPHAEERGQRRAVPETRRHEMGGQLLDARERHTLARQETLIRFVCRPRSRRANRSSRCTWRRSSSASFGTLTTLQTFFSPPAARMSIVTSLHASRRSVFVRRRRRFTSMLEESTMLFAMLRLTR